MLSLSHCGSFRLILSQWDLSEAEQSDAKETHYGGNDRRRLFINGGCLSTNIYSVFCLVKDQWIEVNSVSVCCEISLTPLVQVDRYRYTYRVPDVLNPSTCLVSVNRSLVVAAILSYGHNYVSPSLAPFLVCHEDWRRYYFSLAVEKTTLAYKI